MPKYINADALQQKMTQLRLEQSGDMDKINLIWQVQDMILQAPTADVQDFFTEDEKALINEYKGEVKAVDFKTAILNAVSVALDKVYWQNVFANKPTDSAPTEETHDRFNEFANAQDALQDALKPLLASEK